MRSIIACTAALTLLLAFAAGGSVVSAASAARVEWKSEGRTTVGDLNPTGTGYPACDPGVKQVSGYFDIQSTTNKHYFFWMFESKQTPSTAPVILWMTGGPGCSSGLAVIAENGPCHINLETGQMYMNNYSWNNVANVIYIDQPAGVGFSYGDTTGYDSNETMVAEDMYHFMEAFYKAYPQYLTNPLFVYGESYGGHFAPATAHRIWQGNVKKEGVQMPLTGLSTGNGMTQPEIQLQWYGHLAYDWCKNVLGQPCISKSAFDTQQAAIPECVSLIKTCNANANSSGCATAMNNCLGSQMGPFQNTGLNVYDVRKPCIGDLCYNFTYASAFMNRPDVQQSLGVAAQHIDWHVCSFSVNGMFNRDWMRNFDSYVKDLLNADIRVLVYSGDVDFICNWLGNKAWTLALDWKNAKDFNAAADLPWWLNEMPAGRFRTASTTAHKLAFTFLQIHEAGHMVPMDQPERALEMVKHFLNDEPFFGFEGPM